EGKKAAQLAATQIAAKLASGDTSSLFQTPTKALTFQEHADAWLKSYVEVQRKPGTAEKYNAILRKHWFPTLGSLPITSLTREHIKSVLVSKSAAGFKPKTVKGHLDILRACLSAALEDRFIAANPAARLGKFVSRSGESIEVETFAPAELTTLLETAEREMPDAYPVVLTLARPGLRIGEALTLQVSDLDLERHRLWVRRIWGSRNKALGDRRITLPKSNKSRRVDMSEQLQRTLHGLLAMQEAEAILSGQVRPPWLFPGRDGAPITPGAFWQNVWRPFCGGRNYPT